jgi:signal transduction histidine kinase
MTTVARTPDEAPATGDLVTARTHARALIGALVAVNEDADLGEVLHRVVHAARLLSGARYGALAVLGPDRRIERFVTDGLSPAEHRRIGRPPEGRGVLGLLIDDPRPLRLRDLQTHPAAVGMPEHHPPMHTFLGVPILVRGEVFGIVYLAEKARGASFSDDDESLMTALAAAAGGAISTARLYQTARHRQQWLEASVEVEEQLLAGMSRTSALALVCDRAATLSHADLVCVLLPEGPDELVVHAASGDAAAAVCGARIPVARSVSGSVLRTGVPEQVADFSTDPRVAVLRGASPVGPARLVPMISHGHALGVLFVARRPQAPPLTGQDSALVDAFARQAAIALELAASQERRRSLAVHRDRERIARDLHDLVIQRLFGTGLTVQSLLPRMPAELRGTGDEVVAELDAAIRDLRAAIFALQRPGAADGVRGRLVDAVRSAVPGLGFEPRIRLEGPLDTVVPEEVATHLVAILAEALTNVARHAQASEAAVTVRASAGRLLLQVDDDGVGPPTASTVPGNGLRNMRSRARELGGALDVDRRPGGGTRLAWQVPITGGRARRAGR